MLPIVQAVTAVVLARDGEDESSNKSVSEAFNPRSVGWGRWLGWVMVLGIY